MSSLIQPKNNFFIRFGEFTTVLIDCDDTISFTYVQERMLTQFNEVLPNTYHMEFYSRKARKFLAFDENVLGTDYNPFLMNNDQTTKGVTDVVELFIVDDSDINPPVNLPVDIPSNGIFIEDDAVLSAAQINQTQSNQGVSENNIAITVSEEENDEHPSEVIPVGVVKSPLQQYPNSSQNSNENHHLSTPSDEQNIQSKRLRFSHDVERYQKDNYLSNIFRIDQQSVDTSSVNNTKKGISFVQGTKRPEQKMVQVLSKLHVPPQLRDEDDTDLMIYAVHEKVQDGVRIWNLHPHKKFLLKNELKPNAIPYNPIEFNLNQIISTENRNYELNIYMLTKWDKSGDEKELYRLDEANAIQLHPAPHQAQAKRAHIPPVRLLCVLRRAGVIDWDTCCLSDFIEPFKNPSKRSATAEQTDAPQTKKAKNAQID